MYCVFSYLVIVLIFAEVASTRSGYHDESRMHSINMYNRKMDYDREGERLGERVEK